MTWLLFQLREWGLFPVTTTFTQTSLNLFFSQAFCIFAYYGTMKEWCLPMVKNLPALWEIWVWSLGWEDPLEKGKATHSSILTWRIPWTVAYQPLPSMRFSRHEYWSRLPFPSPGDLSNPGIKPRSPTLQADSLPSEPPGKPWKIP